MHLTALQAWCDVVSQSSHTNSEYHNTNATLCLAGHWTNDSFLCLYQLRVTRLICRLRPLQRQDWIFLQNRELNGYMANCFMFPLLTCL